MCTSDKIKTTVRECLCEGIPFAVYRLPGQSINILVEGETHDDTPIIFYINKFNSLSAENIIISEKENNRHLSSACNNKQSSTDIKSQQSQDSTQKHEYLSAIQNLVGILKESNAKTVISKIISINMSDGFDVAEIALAYFDSHPDTFGFLFYTEQTGCWVGASPELLLKVDKSTGDFETMALAGTMPADIKEWSQKNQEEHEYVSHFISDVLSSLTSSTICTPVEELPFGNIKHLCTRFSGKISPDKIFQLLDLLSPTPAICGYPKSEALRHISEFESHDRECYGGYIAIDTPTQFIAYVNLRSFKITNNKINIYVGGGITSKSDPEEEWSETELKASSIIKIVNNLRYGIRK